MTLYGVGPKIFLSTFIYAVICAFINWIYYPFFQINFFSTFFFCCLGIISIIIGLPIWAKAVNQVTDGFDNGKLVTTGIYALMRHPLYASFILFIVPGLMLFFKSYAMLTVPLFMYLVFRILIIKEEVYLEKKFGPSYFEYRKNINSIIPKLIIGWLPSRLFSSHIYSKKN